jgi:hypothetical protein
MSKSRHTEAQIITALKQVEAGRTVDDVARECDDAREQIQLLVRQHGGDVCKHNPCSTFTISHSLSVMAL